MAAITVIQCRVSACAQDLKHLGRQKNIDPEIVRAVRKDMLQEIDQFVIAAYHRAYKRLAP